MVARRNNSSAVPDVKSSTYVEYERFKNAFEMDVAYTINKDLEERAQLEKQAEISHMQNRQKAMEGAQQKQDA